MRSAIGRSIAVVLLFGPVAAAGDRGALTLELGPALSVLAASPSQGSGPVMMGKNAGANLGVRYGVSNEVELAASAYWEAPVSYYHPHVEMGSAVGTVRGTLGERTSGYGALLGLRLVKGYLWRLHLGMDLGLARRSYARRDLIDVSDPSNPHSFGLGLGDHQVTAFVLAPVAGVEYQLTDHWAVAAMPRLEVLLGGANRVEVLVPISIGYSWYVF
jgi:opacity protein-like surface antigen